MLNRMSRILCSCYPSAQIKPKQPQAQNDEEEVTPLKKTSIECNESTPQTPPRPPHPPRLTTPPTRQLHELDPQALSIENVTLRGLRTAHTPHEATPDSTYSPLTKDQETQTTPPLTKNQETQITPITRPTRRAPMLPDCEKSRV